MTTPTPHLALHQELDELLTALPAVRGRAATRAITREVHALFDLATARQTPPKGISDTNGDPPGAVESALFPTPEDVDRLTKSGADYYGPLA